MQQLNFNHLKYFWVVAREGSIVKAAESLHLTPQTISGQLKTFEGYIGQPLFDRSGKRMVLSHTGHVVMKYADDIFAIGAELSHVVRGQTLAGLPVLSIGIVNSMPKLIAEHVIAPGLESPDLVRVKCHEASLEQLLSELAVHKLDLVLSDQPMPQGLGLRAYNHRLGESGLTFFARHDVATAHQGDFPARLNNAPLLLPSEHSALRRRLDSWLESHQITPRIAGEFDDSALLKAFGQSGVGIFVAPSVIQAEICQMYRVEVLGSTEEVSEQFYAISPERRIRHPSVVQITQTARLKLFLSS